MYISYSFFLVVSFPGFSFPKSIFEKDHCLYADHKEESDFITQIKRNCIHEVKNHQEKSPFVLSRRSRPSRIHYQEERITREDGVEMVIMKSHKEEENKRNELPLLDSTGVFSNPSSPTKQQESLPSLSQHESSISEQNTISSNQNITTNQNTSNNNTTSTNEQNNTSNNTSSTSQNITSNNNTTSNTSTSTNQIDSTIPPPASLQISHSSMNAASSPILASLDRMHDSSSSSHNMSSINTPDHLSGFSITQVHSDHPSGFSIKPSPSIPSPKKNMEDVQIIDYVFCVSSFTILLLTG